MKGIVSCIKHAASLTENTYYITNVSKSAPTLAALKSAVVLHIGEEIEFELSDERIETAIIGGEERREHYIKEGKSKAPDLLVKRKFTKSETDILTSKMKGELEIAAALFMEKLLLGSPIIIRF